MADGREPGKKKGAPGSPDPQPAPGQPPAPDAPLAPDTAAELRRQAEERLAGLSAAAAAAASPLPEDPDAIAQELRVHQIELEMQNEELRRAQRELQTSHDKYFERFEQAPVGYLTLSEAGIVEEANLTAAGLLGVERQEFVGRPFHDFVFAADQDIFYRQRKQLAELGRSVDFELRLKHAGGEPVWASLQGKPMEADEDEPLRIHLTFADVSERRRSEAELAESERLFRLMFEQAPIGAALVGLDFRFLRVNPRFAQVTGYSVEELLERGFPDLTHPDDVAADVAAARRLTAGEMGEYAREKRYVRKDGSIAWVDIIVRPVLGPSGEPTTHLMMARDITAQRRAAEALRESEESLRTVFTAAREGILLQDRDGRIRAWNSAAEDVLGVAESEIVGETVLGRDWHTVHEDGTLWPPEEFPSLKTLATGEPQHDIVIGVKRDGGLRWIDVNAEPVFGAGEALPSAVVVTFADITEQRRAQRAIARERDRAQSYLDIAGVMLVAIGADQNVLFANRKACEVLERDESEIVGHNWFDLAIPEAERETIRAGFAQLMADNVAPWEHVENLVATGSGVEKSVAWHNTVIRDDEGTIVATLSSGDDITESKRTERLMAVPSEILRIIASPAPVRETVGGIVAALKEATGYDAVGMRLEQDGDYPFIGSLGYTDEFLAAENVLAERSPDDELCRNADGSISLECTCGLVISGAADPENPLFTPGGSAWTNDSLPFLDVPPEEDPRLHPRNRCIHVGFRSLALVPLRAGDEILGLLHLGDSHTDRLTLDMVHFFEGLGASIGVAIQSKQVEEALRQSKAMRDITEAAAHVGSVRRDLVTGQSTWSPETYRLFALAPDESVGDTAAIFERCVHPGDRARLEEAAGGVRATGRAGPVEFRVIWPDGSEHILHGESITECDPDGEPVAITGYYQDVTEQRRVEAAIYESELKYRTVADNTYDWEWWTAPDGTYRYVSPGCERITGYSVEEFLADPGLLPAITHPDDDGALRAHLAPEVQEASAEDRLEFRIITKSGDERVIDHRCRGVYDVDGTFLGRRGSNRDATERVRAEEEINKLNEQLSYRLVDRIAQLDMANRELESYAYAVSHDVRTPLRAIDGFSETVLQDEGDKLSPGAVEDLRRVRAAAQEMARLMDDLLGFSKLTHRDLLRRSVDVSALAAEVAAEIAADDAARRVQVSIEPDLVADADPALLRMILRELLGNAWKFTSHHDSAHIEVGALRAGGELEFYVRDDGAGFDEQYAQHLFGLFQRMHPRGEFPGDGVGLATVQRLVRRHGGRVWAEAAVEKGATFSFTLPSEAGAAD